MLEVLRLAKELGVEFAFPTQTVHVDSMYKDEPRRVGEIKTNEELAMGVSDFGPGGPKSKPDGLRIFKDGKEIDFGAKARLHFSRYYQLGIYWSQKLAYPLNLHYK